MVPAPDILCVGSVFWDVIGRSERRMEPGGDMPGRIVRVPGGVAMNVAAALRNLEMTPALLTAAGLDNESEELMEACERMGVITEHVYRSANLPPGRYMAIEDAGGLIAAVADARALETAGARILSPLADGTFGSPEAPHEGIVALDGNLAADLLAEIAASPLFRAADLRVAPASPAKAGRIAPLFSHPGATIYANREEAENICGMPFSTAKAAARALRERGATRVLVTDGAASAADADADADEVVAATPPDVRPVRITGAGDRFMAAHIAAERGGMDRADALNAANRAGADHVAGKDQP